MSTGATWALIGGCALLTTAGVVAAGVVLWRGGSILVGVASPSW